MNDLCGFKSTRDKNRYLESPKPFKNLFPINRNFEKKNGGILSAVGRFMVIGHGKNDASVRMDKLRLKAKHDFANMTVTHTHTKKNPELKFHIVNVVEYWMALNNGTLASIHDLCIFESATE